MGGIIPRSEIRTILLNWQSGKLTHAEVHRWAEERYMFEEWQPEDEVVHDILCHLDIMDVNLITPDYIPVFLSMLALPPDKIEESLVILKLYGETWSLEETVKKWGKDPFYSPFCKSD